MTITVKRVPGRSPDVWVYAIDGVESTGGLGVGWFRSSEQAVARAKVVVERTAEHVCDLRSPWPVGHPLPVENPEKLTGPEVGALCLVTSKYHPGRVVRVTERSYVWSPGECRSNGGYRHYNWSVISDEHGYEVVCNDADLLVIEPGMTLAQVDPS